MSRYIDADALIYSLGIEDEDLYCQRIIEDAPTVDVVPVVRCKDCLYWDERTTNKKGFVVCSATHMDCTENDYCSLGEKVTE